ncbi:MAG: DUF456 family protein [Halodesulfurarchaeum sp.]
MEIPLFLVIAIGLLVAGVVGSFTPLVPAGGLSILGILVYWWSTGYSSPGPLFLAAFVFVGVIVVLVDYAAGVVAAKAGGASTRNSILGGVVGFALFFVLGPFGIILGVSGTVFLLELYDGTETGESVRAAWFAVIGASGSSVMQFVLTLSLLLAFLVLVLV